MSTSRQPVRRRRSEEFTYSQEYNSLPYSLESQYSNRSARYHSYYDTYDRSLYSDSQDGGKRLSETFRARLKRKPTRSVKETTTETQQSVSEEYKKQRSQMMPLITEKANTILSGLLSYGIDIDTVFKIYGMNLEGRDSLMKNWLQSGKLTPYAEYEKILENIKKNLPPRETTEHLEEYLKTFRDLYSKVKAYQLNVFFWCPYDELY